MTTPENEEFDENVEVVDESIIDPVNDADLPDEDRVEVPAPELTDEEEIEASEADKTDKRAAGPLEGASEDQD